VRALSGVHAANESRGMSLVDVALAFEETHGASQTKGDGDHGRTSVGFAHGHAVLAEDLAPVGGPAVVVPEAPGLSKSALQQLQRAVAGPCEGTAMEHLHIDGPALRLRRRLDDHFLDGENLAYQGELASTECDVSEVDPRWLDTPECLAASLVDDRDPCPPTAMSKSGRSIAPEGATALGLAALHCNRTAVSMLLLLGANAASEDPESLCGESPMHMACRCSRHPGTLACIPPDDVLRLLGESTGLDRELHGMRYT